MTIKSAAPIKVPKSLSFHEANGQTFLVTSTFGLQDVSFYRVVVRLVLIPDVPQPLADVPTPND